MLLLCSPKNFLASWKNIFFSSTHFPDYIRWRFFLLLLFSFRNYLWINDMSRRAGQSRWHIKRREMWEKRSKWWMNGLSIRLPPQSHPYHLPAFVADEWNVIFLSSLMEVFKRNQINCSPQSRWFFTSKFRNNFFFYRTSIIHSHRTGTFERKIFNNFQVPFTLIMWPTLMVPSPSTMSLAIYSLKIFTLIFFH